MKLFCSTKLQQKLGCKYEKAPVPDNPLDCWYAHLVPLQGSEILVAMLPEFRFCVVLWDIRKDQWSNLDALLVKAIREALDNPFYSIPMPVIDQYIPEDTVFEPCTTTDRGVIAKMSAVTKKLMESGFPSFMEYFSGEEHDLQKTQFIANDYVFVTKEHPRGIKPWIALRDQLFQTYRKITPALELEISLDLEQYVARRTLLVSEDVPFEFLHHYVQIAFLWKWNGEHQFFLPPTGNRDTPLTLLDCEIDEEDPDVDGPYLWSNEARLSEYLQEGDSFQYFYDSGSEEDPWELNIRVNRRIPDCAEILPVCTLCEGKAPPEWVDGVDGYRKFCRILSNPKHPKYKEMHERGETWLQEDSAKAINARFPKVMKLVYNYNAL